MATTQFTAQVKNYSADGWWESGVAKQGNYGYGTRTGVIYFPNLLSLRSKYITQVKITVTCSAAGYVQTNKTAYFYQSASQGGINTSLNGNHKTGNTFTSVTGVMYNNVQEFTVNDFISKINAGQDTFCIYAGDSEANYLGWTNVVMSVTWQEPTSTFTCADRMTMGSSYVVTLSNANASYTHTLRMICDDDNQTFVTKTTSRTPSISPKIEFASQTPSSETVTATLYVDTYNGTTLIGTSSKSVTLVVPPSVKPTITSISKTMLNGFSNQYVQGKSSVRLGINTTTSYGSDIESYSIVCSQIGFSASSRTADTAVIRTSGTLTFTATVRDERKRTATLTTTIDVVAYKAPTLSNQSYAQRLNDESEEVRIKGVSTWYDITGNSLTMTYSVDDGTAVALTNNEQVIPETNFSLEQSYTIKISVHDSVTTTPISKTYSVPSLNYILDLYHDGTGIAIGGVANKPNTFQVFKNTEFEEDVTFNGDVSGISATDVGAMINTSRFVSSLNDLDRTGFIGLGANITIGGVVFPNYSKGYLCLTGGVSTSLSVDAVINVVDASGNIYVAFRNNGTWTSGRKI